MKTLFVTLFFILPGTSILAQSTFKSGLGVPATFGRPFLADMHSTIVSLDVGVGANCQEYDMSTKEIKLNKVFSRVNLGVIIPIYTTNFDEDRKGFSLSIPLHELILLDLFESTTSPIINTDYSFGVQFKFINRVNRGWLKSYTLLFAPIYHQSTHIGDELTNYRKEEQLPITRVNVSHNFSELSFWINEPEQYAGFNQSFRFSLMYVLAQANTVPKNNWYWYSARPEEADTSLFNPTSKRAEFYFQYQLQTGNYFLSGGKLKNVFSLEIRNRLRYGYPKFRFEDNEWVSEDVVEKRTWNLNLYFGWRIMNTDILDNHLGFGLRYYRGINPHGQFRNMDDYQFIGMSLLLE
ncbi:hypothetical protein ACFLU5_11115 [Bacteroidota bacterium]